MPPPPPPVLPLPDPPAPVYPIQQAPPPPPLWPQAMPPPMLPPAHRGGNGWLTLPQTHATAQAPLPQMWSSGAHWQAWAGQVGAGGSLFQYHGNMGNTGSSAQRTAGTHNHYKNRSDVAHATGVSRAQGLPTGMLSLQQSGPTAQTLRWATVGYQDAQTQRENTGHAHYTPAVAPALSSRAIGKRKRESLAEEMQPRNTKVARVGDAPPAAFAQLSPIAPPTPAPTSSTSTKRKCEEETHPDGPARKKPTLDASKKNSRVDCAMKFIGYDASSATPEAAQRWEPVKKLLSESYARGGSTITLEARWRDSYSPASWASLEQMERDSDRCSFVDADGQECGFKSSGDKKRVLASHVQSKHLPGICPCYGCEKDLSRGDSLSRHHLPEPTRPRECLRGHVRVLELRTKPDGTLDREEQGILEAATKCERELERVELEKLTGESRIAG